MEDMVDKYFKDGETQYYHCSDRLQMKTGEIWLRIEWIGGKEVLLWFGCNNYDEIPIKACRKPEELEAIILALI